MRPRRALLAGVVLLLAGGLGGLALAPAGNTVVLGAFLALAALGALMALWVTDSTVVFTLMFISTMFSGHSADLGIPFSPDRALEALAVIAVVRDLVTGRLDVRLRPRLTHLLMAAFVLIVVVSAVRAGTLTSSVGFYALLDRVAVPFGVFVMAPFLYRTARQRNVLLVALVALGIYLGGTAVLEILGPRSLVVPGYITDPSVGIHFGRARGPFTESVAEGLALFSCVVASLIAFQTWTRRRWVAAVSATLCTVGVLLTYTRAVWLGSAIGALVALAVSPRTRRLLLPLAGGATALLGLVLVAFPSVATSASARANEQGAIWDRLNTNSAAWRIVEAKPVTGIGWEAFIRANSPYQWQAPTYPLTVNNIEVHNVFLSHLAEIGIPATVLFVVILTMVLVPGVLAASRRELVPWRIGLLAIALAWLVAANTGPMVYPYANQMLFLFAGIASTPLYVRGLRPARDPATAALADGPRSNGRAVSPAGLALGPA